jgi:hypothetical protein
MQIRKSIDSSKVAIVRSLVLFERQLNGMMIFSVIALAGLINQISPQHSRIPKPFFV